MIKNGQEGRQERGRRELGAGGGVERVSGGGGGGLGKGGGS